MSEKRCKFVVHEIKIITILKHYTMVYKKFFIRIVDTDKTYVCPKSQLLNFILNPYNYPMRIIPIDSNGNLVHGSEFLVGDNYNLSFLFNDNSI